MLLIVIQMETALLPREVHGLRVQEGARVMDTLAEAGVFSRWLSREESPPELTMICFHAAELVRTTLRAAGIDFSTAWRLTNSGAAASKYLGKAEPREPASAAAAPNPKVAWTGETPEVCYFVQPRIVAGYVAEDKDKRRWRWMVHWAESEGQWSRTDSGHAATREAAVAIATSLIELVRAEFDSRLKRAPAPALHHKLNREMPDWLL